jgi:hypothetical protein
MLKPTNLWLRKDTSEIDNVRPASDCSTSTWWFDCIHLFKKWTAENQHDSKTSPTTKTRIPGCLEDAWENSPSSTLL